MFGTRNKTMCLRLIKGFFRLFLQYFAANWGLCQYNILIIFSLKMVLFFVVDGFLFLMLGTALYNELLIIPPLMPKPESPQVTRKVRLFRLKELWWYFVSRDNNKKESLSVISWNPCYLKNFKIILNYSVINTQGSSILAPRSERFWVFGC